MARELADLVDNYTASRRSRALWHLGREASLERAALKHAIGPRCCGTGSSSIGAESFPDPDSISEQRFRLSSRFDEVLQADRCHRPGRLQQFRPSPQQESLDVGLFTTTPNPQFLKYGGSVQYSMPYLKSSVQDLGLPNFLNRMAPLVEWNLSTQVSVSCISISTTSFLTHSASRCSRRPQASSAENTRALRLLCTSVSIEITLGLVVICVVAVLGQLPPPGHEHHMG